MDEFKIALALVRIAQPFRHLARRGEHGGERNPHQLPVLAEIIEQHGEDALELAADIFGLFRRLAQQAVTLVVRLGHERLEQAGLVLEMIIERGLGQFGLVHDVLHRRGGVARMGEVFERRPQKLPPGPRNVHRLGHKTYRTVGNGRHGVK